MGEEADWLIDQAMGLGDPDFDEDGEYNPRRRRGRVSREEQLAIRLAGKHWVDGNGTVRYPYLPPTHKRGMTLAHIQSIKAKLLSEVEHDVLKSSALWKALCDGEQMHEGELRKAKNLNEGVIKW